MRKKFDNILLGTLWFSITTLGACFWFNIKYGFNIFSNAHWKHLAYMQASQTPVKTSFYISIIAFVIILIGGIYLLLRPRLRKITLPIRDIKKPSAPTQTPHDTTPAPVPTPDHTPTPSPAQPTPMVSEVGLTRPARLNIGNGLFTTPAPIPQASTQTSGAPAPIIAPAPATAPVVNRTPTPQPTQTTWPEIESIFENTGYKILKAPRINGTQLALFALGSNETIWIGAINTNKSAIDSIAQRFNQVFIDTLEDIPITINSFVISATDSGTASDTMSFADIDKLNEYMQSHPNPPLSPDQAEEFDAFAEYISKVIKFIGN